MLFETSAIVQAVRTPETGRLAFKAVVINQPDLEWLLRCERPVYYVA
jgi:hypothetical protein